MIIVGKRTSERLLTTNDLFLANQKKSIIFARLTSANAAFLLHLRAAALNVFTRQRLHELFPVTEKNCPLSSLLLQSILRPLIQS